MMKMNRKDLIQFTHDITDCPYDTSNTSMKRASSQLEETSLQYFYDAKQMAEMNKSNKKQRNDNRNNDKSQYNKNNMPTMKINIFLRK